MYIGGIDAGGSKTECIIYDNFENKIVARSRTGSANYQVVGLDRAVNEIERALKLAMDNVGLKSLPLVGMGVAGAGREGDISRIKSRIDEISLLEDYYITNDGKIALLGATGGKKGIILISGTGSIAYGLKKNGQFLRSGGWGPILGDEGSGFWLGLNAIQSVIKASENRAPQTSMTEVIKNKLEIKNLNQLISFVYQNELPRKEIAALVPDLFEEADKGDSVSCQIVSRGVDELQFLIQSISSRLGYNPGKVAVCGGLFKSQYFLKLFQNKLENKHNMTTYDPVYSAEYGAVLYALQQKGRG